MPESTPAIVRDVDFFLDPIFIRVEDTMFKIPIIHVTDISIFCPLSDGIVGPTTEENPLVLHQISKGDFKAFLQVLVPLKSPHNYSKISVAMWKSILKLSTMWEVTAIRDLAIQYLMHKLNLVDMISLGTEFCVSEWFTDGCETLIMRSYGPTEEECNLLGANFVVQIYGLREHMLSLPNRIPKGSGNYQSECQRIVRETFSDRIFDIVIQQQV